MSYKGIAKGKTIELEEALPYSEGQLVSVQVEPLAGQPQAGFPMAILQVMHEPPHLDNEDVDALEQAIEEAKLPVHQESMFDDDRQ